MGACLLGKGNTGLFWRFEVGVQEGFWWRRKVFGGGDGALPRVSLSPLQVTSAFQGHNHNKLSGDGSEVVSDYTFSRFECTKIQRYLVPLLF